MQYSQLRSTSESDAGSSKTDVKAAITGVASTDKDKLSWKLPLEILLLFVFGVGGALAHQLYYHSLHGKPVASSPVSQEWAVRIGTGLAFVSKTCCTVAILISQTQRVWRTLDQKDFNSTTINALLTSPSDFTQFRHWTMLRQAKVATLLALAAWCLPLSTIVTPATLTVIPVRHPKSFIKPSEVPMVDFNDAEKWAHLQTCTGSNCPISPSLNSGMHFQYPNPVTVVRAAASTTSGSILPMEPTYLNSTYSLTFFGPAFECQTANSSAAATIDRIDNKTAPDKSSYYFTGGPYTYYYAFVPAASNSTVVAASFEEIYQDWSSSAIPIGLQLWVKAGAYEKEDYHVCTMRNASYTANFTFQNSAQSTSVNITYLNDLSYVLGLEAPNNKMIPKGPQFQAWSYQAIYLAIVQQLIGRFDGNPLSTRILQTPIVGSTEFNPYFRISFGASEQPFNVGRSVSRIIEELSQNVTLSYFASKDHWTPKGETVDISVSEMLNVFHFNQTSLLISYGIALLVTVPCLIVGLLAYRANRGPRELVYSAEQKTSESNVELARVDSVKTATVGGAS